MLYEHAVLGNVNRSIRLIKVVGKSVLGNNVVLHHIWRKCCLDEVRHVVRLWVVDSWCALRKRVVLRRLHVLRNLVWWRGALGGRSRDAWWAKGI